MKPEGTNNFEYEPVVFLDVAEVDCATNTVVNKPWPIATNDSDGGEKDQEPPK